MAFLVVLVVAVVVVVLMMRAASASGSPGGGSRLHAPRPPRPRRDVRSVAPDDDPEFLRELERRTRRDDGSPA
jgi:hypothetical protein